MYACTSACEDIAWFLSSEPATIPALLLERGADVNACAPQSKSTPLSVALSYKNFDFLVLLLDYGVKIDIKSRLWLTAHAKDLSSALKKEDP